jgi:hypothetical protein
MPDVHFQLLDNPAPHPHGKNVEVKAGTLLTAYVDEDIALEPAM